MSDQLLPELLAEAEGVISDAERWRVIKRAWVEYRRKGAGYFDWDYDSRDLMHALTGMDE